MNKNEQKIKKLLDIRMKKDKKIPCSYWYGNSYKISDDITINGYCGAFGSNFFIEYKGVELPDINISFIKELIKEVDNFNYNLYKKSETDKIDEFENLKV